MSEECREFACCPPDDTTNQEQVEFWNIADIGTGDANAEAVADYLTSKNAEAIIMAGDLDYNNPHDYAASVDSFYAYWKDRGLLFPAPGNHDIDLDNLAAYFAYFDELVGRRYYNRRFGPIEFFFINSGFDTAMVNQEPDGNTIDSVQYNWLQTMTAISDAPWKAVVLHHSPYSSDATHGSTEALQWDYQDFGIDIVLSGHGHVYEHIFFEDVHYFVNGLGGAAIYSFGTPVEGSVERYNAQRGALRIRAAQSDLRLDFLTITDVLVEKVKLQK